MKVRTAITIIAALMLGVSLAQYANEPYFDQADAVRHAHALNLMEVRLLAIETVAQTGELPEDIAEQGESLLGDDLPRLSGSLAVADESRLEGLREALEGVAEATEEEDLEGIPSAVESARQEVAQTRELLLADVADDQAVTAAAMSRLLLGEPGVGEGYEEAIEGERWEYTLGWAALQRVHEIWADLAPNVGGRSEEVQEALDELDELLPEAIPPQTLQGDPEAGEEPAHRITSLLEGIVDANLYPERELGRSAAHSAQQATAACQAHEAGNDDLGREYSLAVADSYESISGTLGMLATDAHERVEISLAALTGGGDDEEEEGEEEEGAQEGDGDDDEDDDEGAQPLTGAEAASTCSELQSALQEIAGMFGG